MKKSLLCFVLLCFTGLVMFGCSKKTTPVSPTIKKSPHTIKTYNLNDEVHITDKYFKQALIEDNGIDTNNDGKITYEEAEKAKKIVLDLGIIKDFTGIRAFKNITKFYCTNTDSKDSLNLSDFKSLKAVTCMCTKLTNLDVSGCTSLKELCCRDNKEITKLDVSGCTELEMLRCSHNETKELHVSGCTKLIFLECCYTSIEKLDLSTCKNLKYLNFHHGELEKLDLSSCENLIYLCCYGNKLKKLDLSACSKISDLDCAYNKIIELDISECHATLENLDIRKQKSAELKIKVWESFNVDRPRANFADYKNDHPNIVWDKK